MAVRFSHQLKNVKSLSRGIQLYDFTNNSWCLYGSTCGMCSSSFKTSDESNGSQKNPKEVPTKSPLPEEPTNCCMSGCANCVWIQYAEELIRGFDGGNDVACKIIMDKVQDPNMRAFLQMELRTMSK